MELYSRKRKASDMFSRQPIFAQSGLMPSRVAGCWLIMCLGIWASASAQDLAWDVDVVRQPVKFEFPAVPQVDAADLDELLAEVHPGEATWRTIPWQKSLVSAQQLAARDRKLLFIWAMDGNPLGCT